MASSKAPSDPDGVLMNFTPALEIFLFKITFCAANAKTVGVGLFGRTRADLDRRT